MNFLSNGFPVYEDKEFYIDTTGGIWDKGLNIYICDNVISRLWYKDFRKISWYTLDKDTTFRGHFKRFYL